MAYDEELARRIDHVLAGVSGVTSKAMFGGLGFMVDGHMAVAAGSRGSLMVRVEPDDTATLSQLPGAATMVMQDRPLKGWLLVDYAALQTDEALADWVDRGVAFVRTLPPKEPSPTSSPSSTSSTEDRGPVFDGVRIGRPATGALVDAGYATLADLPADLAELRGLHGVGPRAIALLEQARG